MVCPLRVFRPKSAASAIVSPKSTYAGSVAKVAGGIGNCTLTPEAAVAVEAIVERAFDLVLTATVSKMNALGGAAGAHIQARVTAEHIKAGVRHGLVGDDRAASREAAELASNAMSDVNAAEIRYSASPSVSPNRLQTSSEVDVNSTSIIYMMNNRVELSGTLKGTGDAVVGEPPAFMTGESEPTHAPHALSPSASTDSGSASATQTLSPSSVRPAHATTQASMPTGLFSPASGSFTFKSPSKATGAWNVGSTKTSTPGSGSGRKIIKAKRNKTPASGSPAPAARPSVPKFSVTPTSGAPVTSVQGQVSPAVGGQHEASQSGGRLTGGDILNIHNAWTPLNPRLQIVSIKRSGGIPGGIGGADSCEYWIVLSDSVHKQPSAMLDTGLHHLIETDKVAKFGIIQLERYIYKSIAGRRVIVVLDAKVLERTTGAVIGDPRTLKADGTSTAELVASTDAPFIASTTALPVKPGHTFRTGAKGIGFYRDFVPASTAVKADTPNGSSAAAAAAGRAVPPASRSPRKRQSTYVPLPPSLEDSILELSSNSTNDVIFDPGPPSGIGVLVGLLRWLIPRFAAECLKINSTKLKVTMADVERAALALFGVNLHGQHQGSCDSSAAAVRSEPNKSMQQKISGLTFTLEEFRAYPGLAKLGAKPTNAAAAYFTTFLESMLHDIVNMAGDLASDEDAYTSSGDFLNVSASHIRKVIAQDADYEGIFGTATTTAHLFTGNPSQASSVAAATGVADPISAVAAVKKELNRAASSGSFDFAKGSSVKTVAALLSHQFTLAQVQKALSWLAGEGYVYSTIDDDHFKLLDYDSPGSPPLTPVAVSPSSVPAAKDGGLPGNEAGEPRTARSKKLVKVGVLTARDGDAVEITFFVDGITQAVQKVAASDTLRGGAAPHFIIPSVNAGCLQHVHCPEVPRESLQTSVLEVDIALVPAVNELSDSFSDNPLAWVSGSSPALAQCVLRGSDRVQLVETVKKAVAKPPSGAPEEACGSGSVATQPLAAAAPGTRSSSDAELLQIPVSGPSVDADAVLSSGSATVWSAYTRVGLPETDAQWCRRGSGLAMIARRFDSTKSCWLVLPTALDGTGTQAFLALPRAHSRQFLSTTLMFAVNPTRAEQFQLSYKVVFDDVGAASGFATTWAECSVQLAERAPDAAANPIRGGGFIATPTPDRIMIGYVFKDGVQGRGYYRDAETQSSFLQSPTPLAAPAEVKTLAPAGGAPLSMQRVNEARFDFAATWLSKHEELAAMRALRDHHVLRKKLADQLVAGCVKHLATLPARAVVDASTELLAVVTGFSPSTFAEPDSDSSAAAADLMRRLAGAGLLIADAGAAPLLAADDAVAATKLQSWYRGVLIRRCLQSVCALQYNSVCSVGQVRKLLATVVDVGTSGYTTVRREIEAVLRSRAKTQKTDLATQKKDKRLVQATAVKGNPKTGLLSDALKLSDGKLSEYCFLRTTLDTVIGLNSVKQWITDELNDAAQRSLLGETNSSARHVLLKGGLGSGKHTAARMIARMYKLLLPEATGHDDDFCDCDTCVHKRSQGQAHGAAFVSHASDEETICKKPKSFNLYFRHVKAKELDCVKNAVLFYRVGDGDTFDGRENDVWSKHLDDCAKANCVVRQLRHHFGPFLAHFSAPCRPIRAVWPPLLAHTYVMLVDANTLMLCPLPVVR